MPGQDLGIPGPRELSLRQLAAFGNEPYAYLEQLAREHGDTFTLAFPREPLRVVVSHPEDIAAIFALRPEDYRAELQSFHPNIGESSVLFSDGDRHKKQRKLLTPLLIGERLRSYAQTMHRLVAARVGGWPVGEPIVLAEQLRELTFEVIVETVFGVAADDAHGRELAAAMHRWLNETLAPGMFMLSMLWTGKRMRERLEHKTDRALARGPDKAAARAWTPAAKIGAYKAALLQLLQTDLDRARREGVDGREDLLALLVEARYDDGAPLDDEDILSQLVTMLLGGHETTSNTLAWALHHLYQRPDVLAKIRAELDEAFGPSPAAIDPTRCKELRYLDACIHETMRLTPIAPSVSRVLTRDLTLRKGTVPAGKIVWPCIYLAQRHPETWDDPGVLRPERMLGKPRRPSVFLPYGGGRRRCIGAAFAGFEMQILLAEIIRRCEFELLDPEANVPQFAGITITPSTRVVATLMPLQAS